MNQVRASAAAAALLLVGIASCKREERRFREAPPGATAYNPVSMSDLNPGPSIVEVGVKNPYEDNAYAVSEGKRLFNQMNCSGCHSNGGGGIGPPLMDDEWIYGSDPQNIYSTIVEGRPNGMPSFRGRIASYQVWQITAYVRALGGFQGKEIRTTRDDHMMVKESEQARDKSHPKKTPTQLK